jgi:hypothetical protein
MVSRLSWGLVGLLVASGAFVVATTGGSFAEHLPLPGCSNHEAREFPGLERVAASALSGVQHHSSRVSSCAETGSPNPVVGADIHSWPNRQVALAWLKRQGWTEMTTDALTKLESPDGRYRAMCMTAKDGDSSPRYASIYFEVKH